MEPIKYSYLPELYIRPFKINHVHFLDDGTLEDLFTKERGRVLLPEFLITHYNEGGESNNYIDLKIQEKIKSQIDKPLRLVSPEFDILALGVPQLFIKPSLTLMKRGVLRLGNYTKNVGERVAEMRLKPALPSREYLESKGFIKHDENYVVPGNFNKFNGLYSVTNGGPVIIPRSFTTEVHLDPPRSYIPPIKDYTSDNGIIGFDKMPYIKQLYSAILGMPIGTTISSSSEAVAPITSKLTWSFPLKFNYIVTGKVPIQDKILIPGYSVDVFPLMQSLAKRGDWVIRPSLTTEMRGTNVFTNRNLNLSPYITNRSGTILKENGWQFVLPTMDEQIIFDRFNIGLISSWNKDIAPRTGIYINPITRTAQHYTITKIR